MHDYPCRLKPFYMLVNDDGKTVRAMDVLVPGVGQVVFFFQAEDGIRDDLVTGVQTCALPISNTPRPILKTRPKTRNGADSCMPILKAAANARVASAATSPLGTSSPGEKIE